MLFAIDIGNTNIVLGCLQDGEIKCVAAMSTDDAMTDCEYAVRIKAILDMKGIDCRGFDGVALSSVVPPVTRDVCSAVKMLTGIDALIVGAGVKTGLDIRIDDPAQLGSDLVVGAVAALNRWKPPLIIIDMGTATTFSAIDKKGSFLGGAIMPGLRLSLDSLFLGTSKLPRVSIEAPKKAIGRSSEESMRSGGIFGTADMIDGMIDRFCDELGEKATVIATGGNMESIIRHCRHDIIYDGELILRGLAIIWEKNRK
ncbi:MAG: type III pantothenate kinase [Oscillospiraceae bacterium]|nr:type III pantothenate kinase [Oscillospiraceae bacterium]